MIGNDHEEKYTSGQNKKVVMTNNENIMIDNDHEEKYTSCQKKRLWPMKTYFQIQREK